jgi:hypothetical protein
LSAMKISWLDFAIVLNSRPPPIDILRFRWYHLTT